jgi:hypothetical protein
VGQHGAACLSFQCFFIYTTPFACV